MLLRETMKPNKSFGVLSNVQFILISFPEICFGLFIFGAGGAIKSFEKAFISAALLNSAKGVIP